MFQLLCKRDQYDLMSKQIALDPNYFAFGTSPLSLMTINQAPHFLQWFGDLIKQGRFDIFAGMNAPEFIKVLSLPQALGTEFTRMLLHLDK